MKTSQSRRTFIKLAAVSSAASIFPFTSVWTAEIKATRKFRMCLNPGAIGVRVSQEELLDAAVRHGFEAIVAFPTTLSDWSNDQIKEYVGKMKSQSISWGAAGLPFNFRGDKEAHDNGIKALPKQAKALETAGVKRMATWIMPTHESLTYLQNMNLHAARLGEAVRILADHDIKFGLEYVGPKTLMASKKFSFVHSMAECQDLIDAIGEPNVGFQLDSFHWFCAGETKEDLLKLSNDMIITVDLNDARAGYSADEQIDGKRELPAATGVVDTKSFMEALVEIGYDGPVRAEPFNKVLNDMENEEALKATFKAMSKAFALAD
jgi:sugar phosphate isomerase/epimerase